ncbi:MAG TPA: hypothetical protein VK325_08875 [Pseudoxanthomonas sp.]|nr:hypothetical protein [Pseudoxanthomonas sp.]
MLRTRIVLVFLVFLAVSGCDDDFAMYGVEVGQIGLGLTHVDRSSIGVVVVNRSSSNVMLNGLFEVGYVQSPLSYEVKNAITSNRSDGGDAAAIPVLVNLEAHRIELEPSKIYGAVIAKKDLAALLDLPLGDCYDIRAMYKPPDKNYTDGIMPSGFAHICF